MPEGNPQLSSGFGIRNVRWGSKDHKGIDIGVDAGSRVLSLSDGTARIISNATWGSHGQAVVIDHGDGNSTLYGHVNPSVRDGQKVKKGDKNVSQLKHGKMENTVQILAIILTFT